MKMYELLLSRIVTLTNDYFRLMEEVKELKEQLNVKEGRNDHKIVHMKIEKSKTR